MSLQLILATRTAVETFFSVYSSFVINLQLPDGNFGKPYDYYYKLGEIRCDGVQVQIPLGDGILMELSPLEYEFSEELSALMITGRHIRIHSSLLDRRYEYGRITFEVDTHFPEVATARDAGSSALRKAAVAANDGGMGPRRDAADAK
ncbi:MULTISPECIES: hypothetical protein [Gordonia]|uniref:hypothetical protein n=1 Tax=Gordonia TaxID=2053 RepID=UPI0002A62D30|nr:MULTISPECIES: hypothetical protein [Gordonia]MDV7101221.1 hypothetical protein [Gordonia amicalis]NKX79753.1 hypothetical protein [Gordonia amicalis]GAC55189.1 hypothetical protein GOAMI_47_00320 [Gordonia amicalis NBRC 100051 = JCM 11271]